MNIIDYRGSHLYWDHVCLAPNNDNDNNDNNDTTTTTTTDKK